MQCVTAGLLLLGGSATGKGIEHSQGVHQADHGGKGVGHTHQLHMAEQGSLGAAGHGGIGPVRKGCHGHADGSAVAGQGDGVVAVRGHGDGNQQPILGRLGGDLFF